MWSNSPTLDHIFARALLDASGELHPLQWHQRNEVFACFRCNNRKGAMHPLVWLTLIENQPGRDRLANRLRALGVDPAAIKAALDKRRENA